MTPFRGAASAASATMAATSSAAMGWNRTGGSLTVFPSALEIGDAAEKFHELGRRGRWCRGCRRPRSVSPGRPWRGNSHCRSGRLRRWTARRDAGRPPRPPPGEGCARKSSKNSSTALSSNEGELARSITTCAPARASLSPSPVMRVDAALGRGGDDLVAALAQNGDGLRADQAGAADDDDLHAHPPLFRAGNPSPG